MGDEPVHVEEYRGYQIKVYHDEDPQDPRSWDNLGTMVCFHRRYDLGDRHSYTIEEAHEISKRRDCLSFNLYLYDHSGITMKTTPFSCPWDSGMVGIIFITHEQIRKEYNVKRISKKLMDNVRRTLLSEVEEYDNFLTGSVYGYSINIPGDVLSCWGYYGRDFEKNGLFGSARGDIDCFIKKDMPLFANAGLV